MKHTLKFNCGTAVKILLSGEPGIVTGVHYAPVAFFGRLGGGHTTPSGIAIDSYQIEYTSADGRAVEGWFYEDEIEAILQEKKQ